MPHNCTYAAGLFIAGGYIEIYADNTVGCIMSANENITAQNLLYYPYFTRASLNVPVTGDIFWDLASLNYAVSGEPPAIIGKDFYHVISEGWRE